MLFYTGEYGYICTLWRRHLPPNSLLEIYLLFCDKEQFIRKELLTIIASTPLRKLTPTSKSASERLITNILLLTLITDIVPEGRIKPTTWVVITAVFPPTENRPAR